MRHGIANPAPRPRSKTNRSGWLGCMAALLLLSVAARPVGAIELKSALIVAPSELSGPEQKAITMLVEEVEKRTLIRWPVQHEWPTTNVTTIAVGNRRALSAFAGARAAELQTIPADQRPEGYQLAVTGNPSNATVFVIGNDARGVLFGVGRLLRELRMVSGEVSLRDDLQIASAPKYPLRGHQLGYRPKTHSYDAWDLPVWEQYFRDLAVFGGNTVELIPPRSDDDADSPHFPRPPMEMMIGMSRLAAEYGLNVWIWYPALDQDYANPKTVTAAVREWGEVFAQLPRVDAVFVPGGDPGHTQPKYLMALLEKQTANLHRFHPQAQMWISPQGFTQPWLDEFLEILRRDQPTWLSGIVHGPQVRVSPKQLRELISAKYPIRLYPDITHSQQCQYPVSQWDVAFSITAGREGINPRPLDYASIARHTLPDSIGFGTYSEGCNDDVNKCVWSALGWDPDADVRQVLREYSRYFIGPEVEAAFAEGLFALERNWRAPLAQNVGVEQTLRNFKMIERTVRPAMLRNWRFQQALFRAYFDAYVRHRWLRETKLEQQALRALQLAPTVGSEKAMAEAQIILRQPETDPAEAALRLRIFQLGEALFQSIAMQLSVERYQAIDVDRGAMLDSMDYPLNNRLWLEERFAQIRRLDSEPARRQALDEIVNWTNPGPGGFYDDLGNVAAQPHLLINLNFDQDPDRFASPRVDFTEDQFWDAPDDAIASVRRISWKDHAEALYDAPLEMLYENLDRNAHYRLRVIYAGDNTKRRIRLDANDTIEIHPLRAKPATIEPLEFELPTAATASGRLKLTWRAEPGLGGNGRANQVSEVWLIKTAPTTQP